MFKVNTPEGERFMVQLVGPRSYRYGGMHITRGGTLTVTKRTRDYLVKNTGFFADFDPTPAEPIEEIFPPQFGDEYGPRVDVDDFDMKSNPPLTQEQALALASKGAATDQNGKPVASDDPTGSEKGDMGSNDLPKTPPKGGKTGTTTAAAAAKKATATKAGAGANDGKSAVNVKSPATATTVD